MIVGLTLAHALARDSAPINLDLLYISCFPARILGSSKLLGTIRICCQAVAYMGVIYTTASSMMSLASAQQA